MSLLTRKIGGEEVSMIGFGLMGLSAFYGPIESDEDRFKVLDAALDRGVRFGIRQTYTVTAKICSGNGTFKKSGKRDQIFLATKFGSTATGVNGKPEYVRSAVKKSMERLGVDVIDLYYLHRADRTVPIEKTVAVMAELVKEGKVRHLGLSEISSETLRRAHAIHPIAAVQVEYSPFCLVIEDDKVALLKTCRELGVSVVAYSPLGRGMLTGAYKSVDDIPEDDWRRAVPTFSRENFPNVLKIVDGVTELGKKYNATPGQVTLAWVLAQGNDIIPIPGTKKIKYLEENIAAAHIKLSDDDVKEVRAIAQRADAGGPSRYPEQLMGSLLADTPKL